MEENRDQFDGISNAIKELPHKVQDVTDNVDLAVDYFDLQADKHGMVFLPIRNTTCITRHCSGYIAGCLADEACRANLECEAACGMDDFFCQFTCTQSYPA